MSAHLAALHRLPCSSQSWLRRIFKEVHKDPEVIWNNIEDIVRAQGISQSSLEAVRVARKRESLTCIERLLKQLHIHVFREGDDSFPVFETKKANPCVMYLRGDPAAITKPSIAMVGSRRMTPYGEGALHMFVPVIVRGGYGTISGMARGIDGAVHRRTVEQGGITTGVLGTGIDQMYPAMHKPLAESVIRNGGALLSEFPIGTHPKKWHFPQRNKTIAALAKAVIVVEAGETSGALHTACHAIEHGIPVYAVPGSIYSPYSVGTNRLLNLAPVLPLVTVEDLRECWVAHLLQSAPSSDGREVSRLLVSLGDDPSSVDTLAVNHGFSVSECLGELTRLELFGLVTQVQGGWVRKRIPNS